MCALASPRWRIFVVAWILYSGHFATNIVREHYPAFSLAEHGTLRVDEYVGFHPDIFVHSDGHAVIGNQVFVSMLAAVPLWLFHPVLDALEAHSRAQLATLGPTAAQYRIDKPMRQAFFRLAKERGLELRFGGAAVVTTVFFMAPLTALFLTGFYDVLRQRAVPPGLAVELTGLLGFGTPIFFRATVLGQNMFVMFAMFASFIALWRPLGAGSPVLRRQRLLAGLFGGVTLATDYIGVVILPLLYAYLVLPRAASAGWRTALRESVDMIVGSLPPVAFLLYSQWSMYGHPLYPGQYWMPIQNEYVAVGLRGFTLPAPDLLLQNLFHPGFGLYTWGPVLLLALVPVVKYPVDTLIFPTRERRFTLAAATVLLLFCSANQYSRLQWNSGFRYLLPLVPLLVLALSDHWVRASARVRMAVGATAVLYTWVLVVFREPVGPSWQLLLTEGPQLPWYRVLSMTSNPDSPWLGTWIVPTCLLAVMAATVIAVWRHGTALEAARRATGRPEVVDGEARSG